MGLGVSTDNVDASVTTLRAAEGRNQLAFNGNPETSVLDIRASMTRGYAAVLGPNEAGGMIPRKAEDLV